MRVLVTGATGFVGRYVVDELLRTGHEVIPAVHTLPERDQIFLEQRNLEGFCCNLSDRGQVLSFIADVCPQAVIHLAGIAHVVHAAQDISTLMDTNAVAIRHLCDGLNQLSSPDAVPFVFASTALVYGQEVSQSGESLRVDENTVLKPMTAYAKSKAAGEFLLSGYNGTKVLPYIVRPFNHTGPGQSTDYVCPGFARKVVESNDGVIKVGNLEALRDISDVRDIVRAYRLILELRPEQNIFVLGSGKLVQISEVLADLIHISGKTIEAVVDPALLRPFDNVKVCASFQRAADVLGWKPEYTLHETLRDLYRSLVEV